MAAHAGEQAWKERHLRMPGAFVFLACTEARYVSGQIVGATGGTPTM